MLHHYRLIMTVLAVSSAQADTIYVDANNCPAGYAAGVAPYSVAVGDLDGINGPDLAVANWFSDDVSVLLNLGDGTFAAAVSYMVGDQPLSLAIGDLDGVNGPDLAVPDGVSDAVLVLLNLGDGTFAVPVSYPAGNGPQSVAVGDLDGVNGPDLALANGFGNDVSVLLNLGDGTFAAAVSYPVGTGSKNLTLGDLDGVNGPDLAVTRDTSNDVRVLLNLGDGTFDAWASYPAGHSPLGVAVGDLDGVNGADLAVANTDSDDVSVLLNLGDGTFAAAATYAAGVAPYSVAVGDLDGINGPDLAVANFDSHDVSVLLNQGNGTFAAAVTYDVGNGLRLPRSVAVGDLDGVNGPDLAVANGFSNDVSVLLNLGDGTFGLNGTEAEPYCSIQTAIDAAVDGDEVIVAPGTYFERIRFFGKAITLRSSDGPEATVIEPSNLALIFNVEGPDTVMDGFTITGGSDTFGVMDIDSAASPTVINCIFTANDGFLAGGIWNTGSPTLINCTFRANTAMEGGGMSCWGGNPTLINCTFSGNDTTRGGGMFVTGGNPTLINCMFEGNTADFGGGMYNDVDFGSPTLINCTFTGNTAASGGGIFSEGNGSSKVTNSILWDNLPDEIVDDIGSTTTVRFSDVEGGWSGDGSNNIDADPLFFDPDNGDYRLSAGSPCIDAGHNWGLPPDIADLDDDGDVRESTPRDRDGNPRFADNLATQDTGCGVPIPFVVDIGVNEFPGTAAQNQIYLGDLNADRVVGIVDFLALLADWGPADMCLPADLDFDGNVGITDFLILLGNWG